MSLPIKKFREIVFQMLYSFDMGQATADDMIPLLMKELEVTKNAVKGAHARVLAIIAKQSEIDQTIARTSQAYAFERIQSVERNVLRMGVYELLFDPAVPPKVAISEAMRIARKFGSPESALFVNAILDNIYQCRLGIMMDPAPLAVAAEELKKIEEISHEASLVKTMDTPDEDRTPQIIE